MNPAWFPATSHRGGRYVVATGTRRTTDSAWITSLELPGRTAFNFV